MVRELNRFFLRSLTMNSGKEDPHILGAVA